MQHPQYWFQLISECQIILLDVYSMFLASRSSRKGFVPGWPLYTMNLNFLALLYTVYCAAAFLGLEGLAIGKVSLQQPVRRGFEVK